MGDALVTMRDLLIFVQELEKQDPRALDRELVVHNSIDGTETEVKALLDADCATIGLKI